METVVVGYDRTPPGDAALAWAAREADQRGVPLTVMTAYHWPTSFTPATLHPADAQRAVRTSAEDIAHHGAGQAHALFPDVKTEAVAVQGYAGKVLAEAAHAAGLLVVGHRSSGGFSGMSLGSTAMRALADACCPVIVVRGAEAGATDHGRVVAAVDIDEPCEAVLDFAFAETRRADARLTVIHVWDEPWVLAYGQQDPDIADDVARIEREREDRLSALVQDVQRRSPEVEAFHQVATGSAGTILLTASERADLLVTGARRHAEGLHGVQLGPVTQTLLHHAACSVAVVPLS